MPAAKEPSSPPPDKARKLIIGVDLFVPQYCDRFCSHSVKFCVFRKFSESSSHQKRIEGVSMTVAFDTSCSGTGECVNEVAHPARERSISGKSVCECMLLCCEVFRAYALIIYMLN